MNTGDTAWVLISTALVLFMTPGLAFFYGGMVRGKNVLGMLMQNFFAMGILADPLGGGRVHPRVRRRRQRRVHRQPRLRVPEGRRAAARAPDEFFELPDDPVRPVLRVPDDVRDHHPGADHRRHRRPAEVRRVRGVHLRSGWCWCTARSPTGCSPAAGSPTWARSTSPAARSCTSTPVPRRWRWCWCSASARATRDTPMPPHNLPLTMIGTGILWFGWAGFNAGSALAANGVAAVGAHEHVPRRVGRDARLAARRADQGGQGHDARRGVGCGGRPGGDHAVRRLRRRHGADLHRCASPASSAAWRSRHQEARSSSTTASTSSPSTSSAGSSARSCSASSPTGDQQRRRQRGPVPRRRRRAAHGPGRRLGRDARLLVRGHARSSPRSST